jgi:hypothetical protein
VVHGVGIVGMWERGDLDGGKEVGRGWRKREGRKEIRDKAAPLCLSLYLACTYVRIKSLTRLYEHFRCIYSKAIKACINT